VKLPVVRGDCLPGGASYVRPCPFACRYRLDVQPQKNARRKSDAFDESCALDVADNGPLTLEQVGALMHVTRERVRQIEVDALQKLSRACKKLDIDEEDLIEHPRHVLDVALSWAARMRQIRREYQRRWVAKKKGAA